MSQADAGAQSDGASQESTLTHASLILHLVARAYWDAPNAQPARALAELHERARHAVNEDPVVASIHERHPALRDNYAHPIAGQSPDEARGTTIRTQAWLGADDQLTDVHRAWRRRVDRVLEPVFSAFAQSDDLHVVVGALVEQELAPDGKQGRTSPSWLSTNALAALGSSVAAEWDIHFTSENLELAKPVVDVVLGQIPDEDEWRFVRQFLSAMIDDLLDPTGLEQGRERVWWLVQLLQDPRNRELRIALKTYALAVMYTGDMRPHTVDIVAQYVRDSMERMLAETRDNAVHPSDTDVLSMREAAAYLGLRHQSLHTHIKRRAGTPSAVPVQRSGRGSPNTIHIEQLKAWERDHWRPTRRRPRGNV